jgi:hypothetical protein
MRHSVTIFTIMLLISLASCGGSNRVMDTGLLQKRKHLPGWDLSLWPKNSALEASRSADRQTDAKRTQDERISRSKDPPDADEEHDDLGISANSESMPLETVVQRIKMGRDNDIDASADRSISFHDLRVQDTEPVEQPRKRWNKFAIPAFLAALGTIYLGLFSLSTLAVIVAIGVTFTLSGISLWQIRVRDEAGKGFAIIALILGLLAAIATAMVIYVVGFV